MTRITPPRHHHERWPPAGKTRPETSSVALYGGRDDHARQAVRTLRPCAMSLLTVGWICRRLLPRMRRGANIRIRAGEWERFAVRGLAASRRMTRPSPGARAAGAAHARRYRSGPGGKPRRSGARRDRQFPDRAGCPAGMPHMMMAFGPLEFVVTPDTTYLADAGGTTIPAASSPTGATGRRR